MVAQQVCGRSIAPGALQGVKGRQAQGQDPEVEQGVGRSLTIEGGQQFGALEQSYASSRVGFKPELTQQIQLNLQPRGSVLPAIVELTPHRKVQGFGQSSVQSGSAECLTQSRLQVQMQGALRAGQHMAEVPWSGRSPQLGSRLQMHMQMGLRAASAIATACQRMSRSNGLARHHLQAILLEMSQHHIVVGIHRDEHIVAPSRLRVHFPRRIIGHIAANLHHATPYR